MRCSERERRVLVAIVNYRTWELTRDCLHSLIGEREGLPRLRVAIVDNASEDGSGERLAELIHGSEFTSWVDLLVHDRNLGFAGGNNLAIRPALEGPEPPDYVVLLNPDTVVRPGAMARLVGFLAAHPEVGIAGSRIEYDDGSPQPSAFRFPNLIDEFAQATKLGAVQRGLGRWLVRSPISDEAGPTDWVSGACMAVRREVFEDVGLMDEGFFLYFEETDFCGAAARAGWACWYVPESRVVHHLAQATRISYPAEGRKPLYWFESRRRYYLKNHGRLYAVATDLAWVLGHLAWRLRRPFQRGSRPDPPRIFTDFLRHSALFKRR